MIIRKCLFFVFVIALFTSCLQADNRSILASLLHSQDGEAVAAVKLLQEKGYLELLSQGAKVETVLNKALDAQDLKAANALGLLQQKGLLKQLTKASSTRPSDNNQTLNAKLKTLLEQVYGADGDGYMYIKDAHNNEKVDLRWVEIYTVEKLQDKGNGWFQMEIGLGSLEDISVRIPLRVNVQTGEAIENFDNKDLEKTRQLKI